MDLLRRLLSAGGWLAHVVNQQSFGGRSRDEAVRPIAVLFFSLVGLVFVWASYGVAVGYESGGRVTQPSSQPLLQFGQAGLCLAVVGLMNAGWFMGLVPFVGLAAGPESSVPYSPAGIDIDVGVTGVVENDLGDLRRYRDRPARLTGSSLDVHPWYTKGRWVAFYGGRAPVRPDLEAYKGTDLERGTAVLVWAMRPAVRFIWKHGPVILTFTSTAERDRVFGYLGAEWSRSGK
jgi:hypothetical protein